MVFQKSQVCLSLLVNGVQVSSPSISDGTLREDSDRNDMSMSLEKEEEKPNLIREESCLPSYGSYHRKKRK